MHSFVFSARQIGGNGLATRLLVWVRTNQNIFVHINGAYEAVYRFAAVAGAFGGKAQQTFLLNYVF
jgi:hypothetical protein